MEKVWQRQMDGQTDGWTKVFLELWSQLKKLSHAWHMKYSQIPNISCTLIGNQIVDHSDVVGASTVGAAPTTSSPGFNGLGKDKCKMRRESFKFWDLVWLILEVSRYDDISILPWGLWHTCSNRASVSASSSFRGVSARKTPLHC